MRLRLCGAALALLCGLQSRLVCADLASETDFRIDAQPLATALTAFADATHIQIVMAADDLGARRSPGIRGRATALVALGELLRGTSLHFQIISADTVAIVAGAPPPPDIGPSLGQLDDVVVVGHGYTRASNTVAPQEAPAKAPGAPVQSLLGDLPGINVQNSDPFGLYEFGNSVRIRGFAGNQLGISLDGVPLESYDVRDGTPPGRLIDDDDLASVTVAQGSGDVMMPSYHTLGGSVRYSTGEPLGVWDTQLLATAGSDELRRLRARVDTPAWWTGGPEAHFSASRTRSTQFDNARADMGVDHAGFKLAQDFGPVQTTLIYRYGQRDDHDMQSYDARGHVLGSFDLLETPTGDPERDALYYAYWTNGRTDQLLSLQLRATPGAGWMLRLQPYFEHKRGYGYAGVAPSAAEAQYAASVDPDGGVPDRNDNVPYDGSGITMRRETLRGHRGGVTAGTTFERGRHVLGIGGWYERYRFDQDRSLFNVDDAGALDGEGPPIVNYYDRHFDTQVLQFYAKDSSRWADERLRVDIGFKGLHVDRDFSGTANVAAYDAQRISRIRRVDRDDFQPQLGLTYKLDDARELFANYADNFSAAPRNALSAENYESLLRPETSHNIDFGLRSLGERLSASATLYYIDYAHRILELTVSNPYMITEEAFRNVGSIRTYGIEFAAYARPLRGLRVGGTLSLNRSIFRNDYQRYDEDAQAMQTVPVAGKTLPDAPDVMAGFGAQYRLRRFSASANAKYTSRRYSTATNDEHVAGYAVLDAALGCELTPRSARSGGVQLQLQVYNLFDERYIGYITPTEFVDNDNHGQFYLGAPRAIYLSLSASFK